MSTMKNCLNRNIKIRAICWLNCTVEKAFIVASRPSCHTTCHTTPPCWKTTPWTHTELTAYYRKKTKNLSRQINIRTQAQNLINNPASSAECGNTVYGHNLHYLHVSDIFEWWGTSVDSRNHLLSSNWSSSKFGGGGGCNYLDSVFSTAHRWCAVLQPLSMKSPQSFSLSQGIGMNRESLTCTCQAGKFG